jgi:hypothetical protein
MEDTLWPRIGNSSQSLDQKGVSQDGGYLAGSHQLWFQILAMVDSPLFFRILLTCL